MNNQIYVEHDMEQCDIWGAVQRAIEAVLEAAPQTLLQVSTVGSYFFIPDGTPSLLFVG